MSKRYYKIKIEPKNKAKSLWNRAAKWILEKKFSKFINRPLTYVSQFTESNKSGISVDLGFCNMKLETFIERHYMFPMQLCGIEESDIKILINSAGINNAWVNGHMLVVELNSETTESTLINSITNLINAKKSEIG